MTTYALVENGEIRAFALSRADLARLMPHVSFPAEPDDETLVEHGLVRVHERSPEAPLGATLREVAPVREDGRWFQAWEVTPPSPERVAQLIASERARALAVAEGKRAEFEGGLHPLGAMVLREQFAELDRHDARPGGGPPDPAQFALLARTARGRGVGLAAAIQELRAQRDRWRARMGDLEEALVDTLTRIDLAETVEDARGAVDDLEALE